MTVFGYIRVSTDMQDYAAQRSAILRRAEIDEWVEDTGTGKVTQPNLLRLMKKAKRSDEIIVYAFDRLGRNTASVIEIVEGFKRRGTSVISIREGIDINSAAGNMVFQMMCSIAEFEATIISDRVRQGLHAARERGIRLGKPSILESNPKAKEALEYAASLREKGMPYRRIRDRLEIEKGFSASYGVIQKYLSSQTANALSNQETH